MNTHRMQIKGQTKTLAVFIVVSKPVELNQLYQLYQSTEKICTLKATNEKHVEQSCLLISACPRSFNNFCVTVVLLMCKKITIRSTFIWYLGVTKLKLNCVNIPEINTNDMNTHGTQLKVKRKH